jgi:hypothetical protein
MTVSFRTSTLLVSSLAALLAVGLGGGASPVGAQSLSGSARSLDVQNAQARRHDFTYIANSSQVRRFVESGYLVPVRANRDFDLHAVSFPYARPEGELFIRRLASQYRAACGEKLVVTSLTRPQSRQPRNASDRSVHPTGMAIDLRYSGNRNCRRWLEGVLISLEGAGVLEATRERYPAHYHIALFPRPYASYVQRVASADSPSSTRSASADSPTSTRSAQRVAEAAATIETYQVRRGDSLWTIARDHGVSIAEIRSSNDLRSSKIFAGQVLRVPVRSQR